MTLLNCCRRRRQTTMEWISEKLGLPWWRKPKPKPGIRRWPGQMYSTSPDIISVKSVNLCLDSNAKKHRTSKFVSTESSLVVRRGQPFELKIAFNRPFDRKKDALSFIFTVHDDEKPSHAQGTLVALALPQIPDLGDPLEWGAALDSVAGDLMTVVIKPAVTCPVTQWKLDIDTKLINGDAKSYSVQTPILILFNPWNRDDQVFLPDAEEREEYVLSDTTLIWRGSYNRLRPSIWKIGQFEKNVLECSLMILAKIGKVSPPYRGDPIRLSRAMSAAVNSPDDEGVVLGNWSEDFSGGTAPTKWVGSVEIMQQFFKKQKPVKFGQCWIFSGVLATIARAIGIPCRIVTNYSSAHDTQASLTVDYFIDDNGKVMEEMNSDSIWNYHVWDELWMERPDLGVGVSGTYGGWQAVDATPQEKSDGMYRCGPASVTAVKLGEILRPYDNNFLYSEVNADKVFWRYAGPYQPMKLLRKDMYGIGLFISTKAVGRWEREDITSTYKFAEKTTEERDTMLRALRQAQSAFSRYYLNENFNDVYFDFQLLDDIKIGEPFHVIMTAKNKSETQSYVVRGTLAVETILYTGNHRDLVKSIGYEMKIKPQTEEAVRFEVTFFDYYSKLMEQAAFNISCLARVDETDYEYYAQDDFRVRKPDIKITFQGAVVSQQPVDVIVRLTNPLPIPLKKGVFHIEGPGLSSPLLFKISEIPVGGTAASTFKYTPPYAGRGTFAAKFTSKELDDVDGFLAYEVQPRPEDVITSNGNTTTNEIIARNDVLP